MTPSQPSPTNLSDELENIIGKGLGWSKYDQPEDYEMSPFGGMWVSSDGKSGYDITGIVSAITAAYAEAIRGCVPEKVADNIGSSSSEFAHGPRRGNNIAINAMLDNLKKKGLLPDDPINQEKP